MATPFQLREAARVLHAGGLVAYPTESVYGLGCDPLNPAAVFGLLQLKQRDWRKGLILIAADLEQLHPYIAIDKAMEQQLRTPQPHPTTWLVPAAVATPEWLTGGSAKIAVRITDHPLSRALCRAFGGPLVSTSANRTGQAPAKSPLRLQRHFNHLYILHGKLGGVASPSRIIDAESGHVVRDA